MALDLTLSRTITSTQLILSSNGMDDKPNETIISIQILGSHGNVTGTLAVPLTLNQTLAAYHWLRRRLKEIKNCGTSYRYVKLVEDNYEKSTKEEAEVVGMYETNEEGLPEHVADLPLDYPGLEGLEIESL